MVPKLFRWMGFGVHSQKTLAHHANRRLRFEPCEDRRLLTVVGGVLDPHATVPLPSVTQAVFSSALQSQGGSKNASTAVAPVITQPANTTAAVNTPFSDQITASGTPAPTFSLVSAPAGMKINGVSGLISWTPTISETGTINVSVMAKNSAGSATAGFSIAVPIVTVPTITQPANTTAAVGTLFTDQIVASGIPAPAFSLKSAPTGMTINSASGLISWTPSVSQTGTLNVSVTAKNTYGSATASFSIAVPAVKTPSITQPANTSAIVGVSFTDQIVATGTPAPKFSLTTAPVGMSIDPVSGLISWMAAAGQQGTQAVKVTATNVAGSSSKSFTVTVPNTAPVITQPANATDLVGAPFTTTIVATGKPAPTFSLTNAPVGMTINPSSGVITWTPTVSEYGIIGVTVAATNPSGTVSSTFTISVPNPAPAFTTSTTLPAAWDNIPYAATITATQSVPPGTPAPIYSIQSGPTGLTIDPNSGVITWTPTAAQNGTQNVTIAATNFAGTTTQAFTISVAADTTPPTAPTATATAISTRSITLSWTPSTDNVGVAGYSIYSYTPPVYRHAGGKGSGTVLVSPAKYTLLVSGITSDSYEMDNLQPGTTYQYAVAAYDAAGNISGYSSPVATETWLMPSVTWSTDSSNTDPQVSVIANHSLYMTIWPVGNPTPTYTLSSAPAGATFTPANWTNSQLTSYPANITWTPTADEVGPQNIVFQSVNSAGTTYTTIPVNVIADVPIPSLSINGGLTYSLGNYTTGSTPFSYQLATTETFDNNGTSLQYALAGTPFQFQVSSTTNTSPTAYQLVSGPAGMAIDPKTGIGTWSPTQADAGPTSVTVASTNSAGTSTLTFTFPTYFTGAPGPMTIDYFTSTPSTTSSMPAITPTAVWTPPANTTGIVGYQVTATAAQSGVSATFNSPGLGTSLQLPGLSAGQYFVTVTAYDANNNMGITQGSGGDLYTGIVPSINWTFGSANAIVGSPTTIQFSSNNGYTATYSIASGPASAAINATSGLLSWTPASTDAPAVTFVVDAAEGWGTLVMTINVPVYISNTLTMSVNTGTDPVTGATTITAMWLPPIVNVSTIVNYQVTVIDATNTLPPQVLIVPADELSLLISDLGIATGTVQVVALDALGNQGVASELESF